MTTTFDFGDGNGEVPAHRHINPDGSIGGWVADTAWVINESKVCVHAKVYGAAKVFNNATINDYAKVYGKARVYGHAEISNRACIYGSASIYDSAKVYEAAQVYGEADVFGSARVCGEANVFGKARIYNDAHVCGTASVFGNKRVYGSTFIVQPTNKVTTTFDFGDGNRAVPAHRHINPDGSVGGWVANTAFVENTATVGYDALVFGNAVVRDNAVIAEAVKVYDDAQVYGEAKVFGSVYIFGFASVYGQAVLCDDARVYGYAQVQSYCHVIGHRWFPTDDPNVKLPRKALPLVYDLEVESDSTQKNCRVQILLRHLNKCHSVYFSDYSMADYLEYQIILKSELQVKEYFILSDDELEEYEKIALYSVDVEFLNNVKQRICCTSTGFSEELWQTEVIINGGEIPPTATKTPSQQPTGFKIPAPPEPLQFNTERVSEIKNESKKLSAMLNAIYEQDETPPISSALETTQNTELNLDEAHLVIVKILAMRPEWEREELQNLLKGVMLDGVLEHINEAFFDYCDEAFIEGDDPIEINVKLYEEIFK